MRASRLLKLMMTLQVYEKATAQELARICNTSVRTVYRDIDALSAMGIPVYSERGNEGGYRLLHGYRTRLNGLSDKEVETLFLAGLSNQTESMGLQTTLADAQLKLMSALPESMRQDAERLQSRFLLDAPNWFADNERVEHLPNIMIAVREQRCIEITYQRWEGVRQRIAQPLGVVLKGGQWYMVAAVDSDVRTYRVSRILSLSLKTEIFERPTTFNLPQYWQANTARMESLQYPLEANVRLTPFGIDMMKHLCTAYVVANAKIDPIPKDGWHSATLPIGKLPYGCYELMSFGPELEVLEPLEVRQAMQTLANNMANHYQN